MGYTTNIAAAEPALLEQYLQGCAALGGHSAAVSLEALMGDATVGPYLRSMRSWCVRQPPDGTRGTRPAVRIRSGGSHRPRRPVPHYEPGTRESECTPKEQGGVGVWVSGGGPQRTGPPADQKFCQEESLPWLCEFQC